MRTYGRTDVQTDRYDETNTHFRNISIAPKDGKLSTCWEPIILSWLSAHKPSSCIDTRKTVNGEFAMGWTSEKSGFNPRQRQEVFLFSETSRPVLGPTQLPIQYTGES